MNRRELLKNISLLTGASVLGADFFLSGCQKADDGAAVVGLFNKNEIALLDEIGLFMANFVSDCYEEKEQAIIKAGMATLENASQTQFKKGFLKITPQQRQALLQKAAAAAKAANEKQIDDAPTPYFTLFQQLALMGYFTSEPGFTEVLRFEIVPGKYEGCIDYKGETAWANW